MSNKYYWHSRISERKFRQIVRCFAEDKTATEAANETSLDRKSITNIFLRIRRRILQASSKHKLQLSLGVLKTKKTYFIAECEAECKKYSMKYKSRILVVLFKSGLVRAEIIYAESEGIFREIGNLSDLKDKEIHDYDLYEITNRPFRVNSWDPQIYRQGYLKNFSGNLLLYFFERTIKFKGTSREKFILHLRETEWRFNKIVTNRKLKKELEDKEIRSIISKDIYNELLEILRTNPL